MLARRVRRRVLAAVLVAAALVVSGCSGFEELQADPPVSTTTGATLETLTEDVLLTESTPVDTAVLASRTFFASAGIVVLSASDDDSQLRAASLAMLLGVPGLIAQDDGTASPAVVEEIERLGTHTVLVVGAAQVPEVSDDRPMLRAVPAPAALDELQVVVGNELAGEIVVEHGGELEAIADAQPPFAWLLSYDDGPADTSSPKELADLPGLPPSLPTERASGLLLVVDSDVTDVVAVATARAAGAQVVVTNDGDVAGDALATAAIYGVHPERVVGLGDVGDIGQLGYRARVAASGVELPGGGQLVLPGKTYTALRGFPGDPALGALGAQDQDATFARLAALAAAVPGDDVVVPTAELVASRVTSERGPAGTYSRRSPIEEMRTFVSAARDAGVMVLLAFQPGRESFVDQLSAYVELLREPNVGVVLEPRWRLAANETPDVHAGAAGDAEIAGAISFIADLTLARDLPPKLVVVRSPLDAATAANARPEVEVVVQVDGAGVTTDTVTTGPDGSTQTTPGVTAAQVWTAAVRPDLPWWGWLQGSTVVPDADLLALSPAPVLITGG